MATRIPELLKTKIKVRGSHWIWVGALDDNGYAVVRVADRLCLAHREVRRLLNYEPVKRLQDACGIRECVHPDHWRSNSYSGLDKQERAKFYRIQHKYGLSRPQFQELVLKQNNQCAICGREMTGAKEPAVDHNHKTGALRELLCTRCNLAVGFFETPGLVQQVLAYFQKHDS